MSRDDHLLAAILNDEARVILQHELDLLNLLHHRNKNQHRAATWYRYVKLLKSSLTRLLALPRPLTESKLTKAQRADNGQIEASIASEMQHFQERYQVIYIGFSQIIGTGQYVALGMVLMGILARVWCVLKPATSVESEDDEALRTVTDVRMGGQDAGIVISRDALENGPLDARAAMTVHDEILESKVPSEEQFESTEVTRLVARSNNKSKTLKRLETAVSASDNRLSGQEKKRKKKKKDAKAKDEIDSIFG